MTGPEVPDSVKRFIYDSIDSVSLLEALILVSVNKERSWTADSISSELRSSPTSAGRCLSQMLRIGLIVEAPANKGEYRYSPKNPELAQIVELLPDLFQSVPHRLLELIFSPLKQARIISNGFRISSKRQNDGDDNG